jgi:hypothetical protein
MSVAVLMKLRVSWWWRTRLERVLLWFAHRLPARVVYWVLVRAIVAYTGAHPKENVPSVPAMDVLKHWRKEGSDGAR